MCLISKLNILIESSATTLDLVFSRHKLDLMLLGRSFHATSVAVPLQNKLLADCLAQHVISGTCMAVFLLALKTITKNRKSNFLRELQVFLASHHHLTPVSATCIQSLLTRTRSYKVSPFPVFITVRWTES